MTPLSLTQRLAEIGPPARLVDQPATAAKANLHDVRVRLSAASPASSTAGAWRGSPEGYRLEVGAQFTTIEATDERGVRQARRLLDRLSGPEVVSTGTIEDWPEVPRRGIVEGFYGPPWSWSDRRAMLDFSARNRLNDYVYAPKDDRFARADWREAYPESELAALSELAVRAAELGIRFAVGLSTGLDMQYSQAEEQETLRGKAEQLRRAGINHLVLLFDDISETLRHPADLARFGTGAAGLARAHAFTCAVLADAVSTDSPLAMVPTDYSSNADSLYRSAVRTALPVGIDVYWTGPETVTGSISAADLRAARATFGRPVQLWDNFPVNDFAPERLFLGPLTGRSAILAAEDVSGVAANPMIAAIPSQVPVATFAEWAWNPAAYRPAAAWTRARRQIAGTDAEALAFLFEAAREWPPDAPRHPRLAALVERAVQEPASRGVLAGELAAWTDRGRLRGGNPALLAELAPWLSAAAAEADAVLAAIAAVEGRGSRAAALSAIEVARQQRADVCRDLLLGAAGRILGEHAGAGARAD